MRGTVRYLRLIAAVLALILLSGPVSAPAPQATPLTQDSTQKKEIRVWVNTNSGIYHCPGRRCYGKTKEGKYMSEGDERKAGYRAAYYGLCGSDCEDAVELSILQ